MNPLEKIPHIEIEPALCPTPFACKRCLQVCHHAVFWVEPTKMERGRETDPHEPGSYRLTPLHMWRCVVCNDCLEACPTGALKITF